MNHDPLCIGSRLPEEYVWPARCDCDVISRVREDERERRIADSENGVGHWILPSCEMRHDVTDIYNAGRADERGNLLEAISWVQDPDEALDVITAICGGER